MFQQFPKITKTFQFTAKTILAGAMTILMIIGASFSIDVSLAHPPQQEEAQPDFTVGVQISPDGSATVESQETRLDSAYFAAQGSLDGLVVTPAGLALAQERDSGVYVSGVINSPLAFTTDIVPLWSANLPDGAELQIETRLSFDGQTWSQWLENPTAFYPVRDDLHSGHLIWVGNNIDGSDISHLGEFLIPL